MRGARHYALGEGGGCLTNLNVSSWRLSGLSHRAWQIGLAMSIATLAAGTVGFMIEEPSNQDLPQAVA
jgi:hypothetical protein